MTWEQFFAALGAIALTAIARLVNRWLPPDPGPVAQAVEPGAEFADSEPMAGPPSTPPATE